MKSMRRADFTGRVRRHSGLGMVAAQFASATSEMGAGFKTNYIYDPHRFGRARQANEIIEVTSEATGNRYGVQIRPVFTHDDESIGERVTMGTIVEVNGCKLQPLSSQPVWLENQPGGVYVRPEK